MIIWLSVCCCPPSGSLDFILPTDFHPIDINFLMLTFMNVVKWPYSSHRSPSLQPSDRASSRGTQGLFSVKNLFGEENIALNFLLLEEGADLNRSIHAQFSKLV